MIRKITTFTSAYIQIQTFTLTQLYNAVSTVIRDDLWVWRKEICPEMNCFVSLPYAGAVHDVKNHSLAIFALWLCIRMCRVIPSADPAHFFSPRPHTVHVYWCVVAASAGFFSFFIQTGMTNTDNSVCAACFSLAFFRLHLKELVAHMQFPHVFLGLCVLITVDMHGLKSTFTWTWCSCTAPTCLSVSLSPSQDAAAQPVSAVVSLALDPAEPGPWGLSVLVATCYLTVNALTHKTETDRMHARNHCVFLKFSLKGVVSFWTHARGLVCQDSKQPLAGWP